MQCRTCHCIDPVCPCIVLLVISFPWLSLCCLHQHFIHIGEYCIGTFIKCTDAGAHRERARLYMYMYRESAVPGSNLVSPVALQDHCVLCYTLQMVEQDTSLRPKMLQTPLATDHTILPCIQYTIKLKCCDAESLYTFPYCNVIIFFARAPVCEIKFSYS